MRKLAVVFAAVAAIAVALPSAPLGAQGPQPAYVEGITFGDFAHMPYVDGAQVGGPGEPSIKVDSAGTIYVAGVCCLARGSPAWYSQDDGATFAYLPSPADARENGIGAEGDFIIDDADGAYFADTWVPSLLFTRWSDHGDVWEYTEGTPTVVAGVDDRPWLAYTRGAVFLYINHISHIAVYRSLDGGHTWETKLDTLVGQRYFPGMISADRRSGAVYLFGDCGPGVTLCVSASQDLGETWTETVVTSPPRGATAQFMVATDVDAAGNVYGTFADISSSGCDVHLAVSSDRGATWKTYKVNADEGCSTFPWVAAGDDGRVTLSWYHNPEKRHQNSVSPNSEWRLKAAVVTGATSDEPVVTYGTMDRVIHKGGLARDLWDFQQVAIGPDGRFHIAYAEDALQPCSGALSTHGGLAGYTNKCTTYVGQAGGPRAIAHAADATSVDALEVSADGGAIEVAGTATFGRAAPVTVLQGTDDPVPYDIRSGSIVKSSALADAVTFELHVEGIPEAGASAGATAWWPFSAEGERYDLFMRSLPRRFEVCAAGGVCTPVRGDVDAGGDRFVAHVPLALVGLEAGEALAPEGQVSVGLREAGLVLGESATATGTYTVPGAEVRVTVEDDGGNVVTSGLADVNADLTGFSAVLGGLAPGDYTVTVEACFAGNCASESASVTV